MVELSRLSPAAVVFDNDGLLVDTEGCWTEAETVVFARRGVAYDLDVKARFIGTSVPDTVAMMAEMLGEVGREDAIAAEVGELVADLIATQVAAMPGAVELVTALRGRVPIAVASNSPRDLLESALRPVGLWGAFDAVVSFDDVAAGKPAPDLYLEAARRLGARAGDCVAFEDSVTGMLSARAAGMTVIGVPTLPHPAFTPEVEFGSLADPALQAWAAAVRPSVGIG